MTDIAVEVVTHRSRYQINAGQLQRRWVIPAGDPTVAIVHKAQIAVTSYIESPPKRFKSVFQTSMWRGNKKRKDTFSRCVFLKVQVFFITNLEFSVLFWEIVPFKFSTHTEFLFYWTFDTLWGHFFPMSTMRGFRKEKFWEKLKNCLLCLLSSFCFP